MVTPAKRSVPTNIRAARIAHLASEIAGPLEFQTVVVDTAEVNVEEWRSAARKAGRDRRWRVNTGVFPDGLRAWAVRTDREVSPLDLQALVASLDYSGAASDRALQLRTVVADPGFDRPQGGR